MRKWKLADSLHSMSWNDHLLYWGYLLFVSLVLILLYFQGLPWMQELAAPKYNREFGLVENAQNLLLLFTAYMAFRLVLTSRSLIRVGYLLLFCAAVFTFLEEIDYGYHYINYLNDANIEQRSINHNIHNTGNNVNNIRLVYYILILVFVIILPYFPSIKLPSFIKHFVPTVRLQITLLASLVISKLVGLFNDISTSTNMALHLNLSEFEEVCLYYLLMLYVYRRYHNEETSYIQEPVPAAAGDKLPNK